MIEWVWILKNFKLPFCLCSIFGLVIYFENIKIIHENFFLLYIVSEWMMLVYRYLISTWCGWDLNSNVKKIKLQNFVFFCGFKKDKFFN